MDIFLVSNFPKYVDCYFCCAHVPLSEYFHTLLGNHKGVSDIIKTSITDNFACKRSS